MRDEERDNGLESLFRNKLEENELVAGSDLTGRLMQRLGRREFFRLNPARFNIWYVTAAAAGLMVAGILLFSPSRGEAEPVTPLQDTSQVSISGEEIVTEAMSAQTIISEPVSVQVHPADSEAGDPANEKGQAIVRHEPIATNDKKGETIALNRDGAQGLSVSAPLSEASIEPSVTSGCVPLHVKFSCNAGEGYTASWSLGDGGTSSEPGHDYIYDIPGTYRVTLTLTDERRRVSTATEIIEVWDNPRAAFEVRQNDPLGDNDRVTFVNLSTGAVNYLWDFGDGTFSALADPSYRYERMGRYDVSLVAYSANGCVDSVTVNDLFTDRGMYLRFPNAFIPNRGGPTGGYYNHQTDEYNQVFHPVASGVDSYNLKIYSKSGLLVFESDDIAVGWDGYNKGRLCTPGVYVWKVRGTYRNGQSIIMAGDVTLVNY